MAETNAEQQQEHAYQRLLAAHEHIEDDPKKGPEVARIALRRLADEQHEGCDCAELCSMGPTCPGGMLARLPGSGCSRLMNLYIVDTPTRKWPSLHNVEGQNVGTVTPEVADWLIRQGAAMDLRDERR